MTMVIALFSYAFVSTVAMSVVPHEPVVIWWVGQLGTSVNSVFSVANRVRLGGSALFLQ